MTNKTISGLVDATVPLAGTELVPVWDSTTTKKVTVDNLTAGKDFSALGLTLTGLTASYGILTDASKKLISVALTGSGNLVRDTSPTLAGNWLFNTNYTFGGANYVFKIQYSTASGGYIGQSIASGGLSMMQGGFYRGGGPHITDANSTSFAAVSVVGGDTIIYGNTGLPASTAFTAVVRMTISGATGNATLSTGNFIPATSGKGIDFSAVTAAAGMTSKVLTNYEEGTFTPTIIGTTTAGVGTYTAQIGRYTRIGNLVTFNIALAWTAHTGTGNLQFTGLPFPTASVPNNTIPVSAYHANIAMTAGNTMQVYVMAGTSSGACEQIPAGGGAPANVTLDIAGSLLISGSYRTN